MEDAGYCINNCAMPGSNSVDFMPARPSFLWDVPLIALTFFNLVQYFPSWFPGTQPATQARAWKHIIKTMYDVPYNDVNEQLVSWRPLLNFSI